MRGFRSTIVLLVVLVGLGAYIYMVELKKPAATDTAPKQKAFTAEPEKIEEVQITTASGDRTVMKKVNGTWQIAEPVQVRADETEATGVTTNLAQLEIVRVVDESPADLGQYGLAKPRIDVAFRKSGEKDFSHLLIGDKTATGGDLYAKLPSEKRVFLVAAFLDSTFNKTTFDLREKSILAFERDKVDQLEVTSGPDSVAFAKSGTEWKITRPIQARADLGAVEGVIGRIQSAQMKSIVTSSPTPKDLAQYGLDKPVATVVIGAGSARASLEIGKPGPSGQVYALDLSRPMVFTIEGSIADDLKKKPDDYRPKDLFEFRSFTATRLEVTRGGATQAFEKVKVKDAADKWQLVGARKDVDAAKMESLLSSLTDLQAVSFADAKTRTGADAPVAVVVARSDDGKKEEKVVFGKVGNDVFAVRAGEAGAAHVDAAKFDAAMKALDALK